MTGCRCEDRLVQKYGPAHVCWSCFQIEKGGDGSIPQPESDEDREALEAMERQPWAGDYMAPFRTPNGKEPPPFFHSPTNGSPVAERKKGLPFMPLGEAIKNAPPEPNWVWNGYIAPGQISLVAGRPKVGKSTLVFGLVAAMLDGRGFVARETRCKGVLLLTEEGLDTLAEKARLFGIADNPRFHVLLRRQVQASWPEAVIAARDYCREHDLDVLIIDTFDKWTGLRGDDENRSGPILEACNSLLFAAGDGLAVVVVTHQRKARGEHGEAVRGSNALVGAVDIIIELERVTDVPRARALIGTSRHTSTPEELAIELTDDGFVDRGDIDALKEQLDTERVLEVLSETDWSTTDEVAEAIEVARATVNRRLSDLYEKAQVEREGRGKKGSPFRWRIDSATRDPLVGERKNGGPPEREATPEEETLAERLFNEYDDEEE